MHRKFTDNEISRYRKNESARVASNLFRTYMVRPVLQEFYFVLVEVRLQSQAVISSALKSSVRS